MVHETLACRSCKDGWSRPLCSCWAEGIDPNKSAGLMLLVIAEVTKTVPRTLTPEEEVEQAMQAAGTALEHPARMTIRSCAWQVWHWQIQAALVGAASCRRLRQAVCKPRSPRLHRLLPWLQGPQRLAKVPGCSKLQSCCQCLHVVAL